MSVGLGLAFVRLFRFSILCVFFLAVLVLFTFLSLSTICQEKNVSEMTYFVSSGT